MRAVTGADPVWVYCESYNPPWSWFPGAAAANAIFEMTGGLRFALNGSWRGDGFQTSWTGAWRAVGQYGSATWDGDTAPAVDAAPGADVTAAAPQGRVGLVGLVDGLADFVTALRTRLPPQGECHDNLRSLAMCHAAIASARTGARVPVTA